MQHDAEKGCVRNAFRFVVLFRYPRNQHSKTLSAGFLEGVIVTGDSNLITFESLKEEKEIGRNTEVLF